MPNQQYDEQLVRPANINDGPTNTDDGPANIDDQSNNFTSGPTAVSREASTPQPSQQLQTGQHITAAQQNISIPDNDVNASLGRTVHNVQCSIHQNKDVQSEAAQNLTTANNRPKRVKFSPKRFIKEF